MNTSPHLRPGDIPAGGLYDANAHPPVDRPEPAAPDVDPRVDQEVADALPNDSLNSSPVPQSPPNGAADNTGVDLDAIAPPVIPRPHVTRTGRTIVRPKHLDPDVWKLT